MTHFTFKIFLQTLLSALFVILLGTSVAAGDRGAFLNPSSLEMQMTADTNCISQYYDQLTEAQILQYTDDNKKEWLKYMPSVGLTYTPAGEPRPSASINPSSLIYSAYKDKRAKEATIRSIRLSNNLAAQSEIQALQNMSRELQILKTELLFHQESFAIDTELFDFYTKQYQSTSISPSEYLKRKKEYFTRKENLRQKKVQISTLESRMIQQSRCNP